MYKPTNNKCKTIKGECNFEFNNILNLKTSYDAQCCHQGRTGLTGTSK